MASEPVPAYVAFGSNIEDRRAYLSFGINGLLNDRRLDLLEVSSLYETDPVGGPPQGSYLNAVALFSTRMGPHELLELAHRVEARAGRDRASEERWGPRVLDIDLLAVGGHTDDSKVLTLPHPRIYEREFVLTPLLDLPASIESAIDFERVIEAAERARGTQGVVKVDEQSWF